jgi:Na+-transporting NADH:ubiquinone oxidoreductase subunit F
MTPWMRKLHKWVALVLALQFLAWMVSGLALSLIDHHAASGGSHRAEAGPPPAWPTAGLVPVSRILASSSVRVQRVETGWLVDRPVYRLATMDGIRLADAREGSDVRIDAPTVRALATADYVGDGHAGEAVRLDRAPREAIEHEAPLWQVRFDDADATTLYVSAVDGRILERRNRQSRWFDVFWMLHTMDYSGRGNFNHPLVVVSAAAGVWVALTGAWLAIVTIRRRRRAGMSPAPAANAS